MFDTHAIARSLTDADFTPAQADALTDALRQAAEQGNHVTADQFKAGLAELRAEQRTETAAVRTEIAESRAEIANLESRLIKWIVGTAFTAALASAAITTVLLRLLGD